LSRSAKIIIGLLLLALAGTLTGLAATDPGWNRAFWEARAAVLRAVGIDPTPKQGSVKVVHQDPAAVPAEGGRPGYDPQQDPARLAFEEVVDLVNSYGWATDHFDRAKARIAEMERDHPASPYLPLARAELVLRVSDAASEAVAGEVTALVDSSFTVTRRIPDAYVMLAKIHLARNDFGRAKQEAERAYRLAPEKPEVLFINAHVADKSGRIEDAERLYRENLRRQKNEQRQSNTHMWMAWMYQRLGPAYEKQSNDAFLAAVSLDPRAPWKLHAYGDFLLTTSANYEAASHYFKRAWDVMQHPRFASSYALAAYAKWADFYANKGANFRPFDAASRPLDAAAASPAQARRLGELTGLAPEDAFVTAAGTLRLGYLSEALLAAGAVKNIEHAGGPCACTALGHAAISGNVALTRRLLARKANVDAASAEGVTPLMRAAGFGHVEVTRLLLEHGARANATARDGYAPIHGRFRDKNDEVVAVLLKHRADPDLPASNGMTLLCWSVVERSTPLLELMLAHRADPNRRCGSNLPLERALYYGWADGTRRLLAAGADAGAVNASFLKLAKRSPEAAAPVLAARGEAPAVAPAPSSPGGAASSAK
jgi:Tfp pilus assembly protein PilF